MDVNEWKKLRVRLLKELMDHSKNNTDATNTIQEMIDNGISGPPRVDIKFLALLR